MTKKRQILLTGVQHFEYCNQIKEELDGAFGDGIDPLAKLAIKTLHINNDPNMKKHLFMLLKVNPLKNFAAKLIIRFF